MAGGQRLFLPTSHFTFKMNDALQTARIQLILCLGPTNANLWEEYFVFIFAYAN